MKDFFVKLWNWFDGKKVKIGGALALVSAFLSTVVGGIWGATWGGLLPNIVETINWFALTFGATGIVHKGVKNAGSMRSPSE